MKGVCYGKMSLTVMGAFQPEKKNQRSVIQPRLTIHAVKIFTKVGTSDYETKGSALGLATTLSALNQPTARRTQRS